MPLFNGLVRDLDQTYTSIVDIVALQVYSLRNTVFNNNTIPWNSACSR